MKTKWLFDRFSVLFAFLLGILLYPSTINSAPIERFLPEQTIIALDLDKYGNCWCNSKAVGIYRILNGDTTSFTMNDGMSYSRHAYTIKVDSRDWVWFGNDKQDLQRLEGGITPTKDDDTWTIWKVTDTTLSNNHIWALEEDLQGNIWCGFRDYLDTPGGIDVYDPVNNHWINFNPENSGLIHKEVMALKVDPKDGSIWIGLRYFGIDHLNFGASPFDKSDDVWTNYNTDNSQLADNAVRDFSFSPKGDLWIATLGGTTRFDRNNKWRSYTATSNGLPDPNVNGIDCDLDGFIWCATNAGVCKLNPRTGSCQNYGLSEGIPSDITWDVRINRANGDTWIATDAGLAKIPRDNSPSTNKDDIYIYPNPWKQNATLPRIVNLPEASSISIYNVSGQLVFNATQNVLSDGALIIDQTPKLATGLYLVVIELPDAAQVILNFCIIQ